MKLGPFLGINTRLPEFDLQVSTSQMQGNYLRDAVNLDILNDGTLKRRAACESVVALTGAHSLFGGYFVQASALYKWELPYNATMVKLLTSDDPMSYVEFNGDIYYSNGTDSGRIAASGDIFPWALPTPDTPIVLTIGGALNPGWYQVTITYTNSVTGEEGGAAASNNHELTALGGIRVQLPAAIPGATHLNIYCSGTNGGTPYLVDSVAVGAAVYDIIAPATGREANLRYEQPLPAGSNLFIHNGRLCSVKGNTLYYCLPHRFGYCLTSDKGIPFPADIAVAASNQMGVYVATADKTYWLQGTDLAAVEMLQDPLPYGAVPGTAFALKNKPVVGWFSSKGFVLGDTQGQLDAPMADKIVVTPTASGMAYVFETNEHRRVYSCGWCMNLDTGAAVRYEDYDFNSMSDGYGLMSDGLYQIEGDGMVPWSINLGKLDFKTDKLKHMPAAYIGLRCENPVTLRITTPDGTEYDYLARSASEELVMQRIDPGKGLRATWFGITFMDDEGHDATIASVSFAPVASTRRI